MSALPIIGITMGDPASIGPEIAIKALLDQNIYQTCRPLLVGSAKVFSHIIHLLGLEATINPIKSVKEAQFSLDKLMFMTWTMWIWIPYVLARFLPCAVKLHSKQ
jgi:4-hydroxythreonine-4-phosphate dehydrogenase